MNELKPCPFCGGEAVYICGFNSKTTIECLNCHVSMDNVTERWNMRYTPTCRKVENSRIYKMSDGRELYDDGCSICNAYLGDADNYCSNCGAKVVSE